MLLNLTTQTTISDAAFRGLNNNISFPEVITDADLLPFGHANVFYFAQPEVVSGFQITQDGFEEVGGIWRAKWVSVPKSAELLEQERINAVHAQIAVQESRLTQRVMREALATGDMTLVNEVEANIVALRAQLLAG